MNYLQIKRKLEQTDSEKLTQLVRYYGINEPNDNDRLWKLAMYITTQKKPKEHPKGTRSYIYQENVSGAKEYYTHNNDGHPFLVRVDEDGIHIFRNPDNSTGYRELLRDDEVNPRSKYSELVDTITDYQGYWWGFDPNDPTLHGNSILVDIDDHNYLYIGDTIYRFKTKDVIKDYVSTVDDDVPYPVGFGDDNVYLMLDQVYVPRDKINTQLDVDNAINVYREFYGHLTPGFTKKDIKKIQVDKQ